MNNGTIEYSYELYIAVSPEKVWKGLIDAETTKEYVYGTWSAHWDEAVSKDAPSRVTYQLTPINATTTRLNLVHDDFAGETATYTGSVAGWPLMLSSLKSLLETGKPIAAGNA